eukprot:2324385-Ditylum_brightwellii.AAC.1
MVLYKACAVVKACQKNVPKSSKHIKATKPGEQVFTEIATIKGKKDGPKVNPKQHWSILVDERSTLRMTKFYKTKSGMVEPTLKQFQKWQQQNILVKYVRCDNAGENKSLEKRAKSSDWKFNI